MVTGRSQLRRHELDHHPRHVGRIGEEVCPRSGPQLQAETQTVLVTLTPATSARSAGGVAVRAIWGSSDRLFLLRPALRPGPQAVGSDGEPYADGPFEVGDAGVGVLGWPRRARRLG